MFSNGTSTTVEVKNSHHMLTGLTPFANYSVLLEVAAVNDGGTGPYNAIAFSVETQQNGE